MGSAIKEVWKVVPSLPEYEANEQGRMKRIPWEAPMPRGGGYRVYGGYSWPGTTSGSDRRPRIMFRGKNYKVADLVCEAFHGERPFPGAVAVHKDGDVRNCAADNLQWGASAGRLSHPRTVHANPITVF